MIHSRLLLLAVLATTSLPLAAAERTRTEPVHLRADRIEIDQKKGLSRYLGNVSLRQGALQVTAARAEARSRGDTLEFVTAEGAPLTFRDQPPGLDQPVHGVARRLEYEALERRVHLYGEVEIHHGDDLIRADSLHYDIANDSAQAESGAGTRVQTTLTPRREDSPHPGRKP